MIERYYLKGLLFFPITQSCSQASFRTSPSLATEKTTNRLARLCSSRSGYRILPEKKSSLFIDYLRATWLNSGK